MSWVILILTFIVFVCSPNQQVLDSNYSMLLSEHLYRTGSCVLDDFFRRPLPAPKYPGSAAGRLPYQIREIAGHVVYFFPAGSAVLSIPFVAGMNALGISAIAGDQTYNAEGERRIQGWLAPLLMAVFSVLVFRSARLVLPPGWSALVALVASFGSQVWSTASRAVWSHTWGILLLATVLYLALRAETTGRRLPSVAVGSLLAWMYFVRPTFLISAVAISFYVLFRHRKRWGATTAAAVLWLLAFVGYSFACFRSLVPPYYESSRLDFGGRSFWVAVAGNLISPSRGLVIFVPAVLIVFYLVLRYRSFLSNRAIVNVALVCVVGQLVLVSSYRRCEAGVCLQSLWWGGHSYGPRLMTDVLPWLVLLAIYGIEAQLQALRVGSIARQRWLRCSGWAAAMAACSLSIVINGGGAISRASVQWNLRPTNIDWNPDRLWDWRDPQALAFLRGVRSPDIQRRESEPSPRNGSRGEARE